MGNVKKIRERQLAAPADSETLQSLVVNELKTKKHTATEGLLWLVRYLIPPPPPSISLPLYLPTDPSSPSRGLDFTAQALRHNLSNPTDELSASFRSAYGTTLKPHHSFMVKPIFSAAMSATPYRKDFYQKLSGGGGSKMDGQIEGWLSALEMRVGVLKEFMGRKEAKW